MLCLSFFLFLSIPVYAQPILVYLCLSFYKLTYSSSIHVYLLESFSETACSPSVIYDLFVNIIFYPLTSIPSFLFQTIQSTLIYLSQFFSKSVYFWLFTSIYHDLFVNVIFKPTSPISSFLFWPILYRLYFSILFQTSLFTLYILRSFRQYNFVSFLNPIFLFQPIFSLSLTVLF